MVLTLRMVLDGGFSSCIFAFICVAVTGCWYGFCVALLVGLRLLVLFWLTWLALDGGLTAIKMQSITFH